MGVGVMGRPGVDAWNLVVTHGFVGCNLDFD